MDYCTTSIKNNFVRNCVCRCCLAKNTDLKPIFSSIGSIPQVIFLFTAVKIEEDDNLPATICTSCINHLNKCINFKRKVESTDFFLRTLLENSSQSEGSQGLYDYSRDHDYAKPIENSLQTNLISCDEVPVPSPISLSTCLSFKPDSHYSSDIDKASIRSNILTQKQYTNKNSCKSSEHLLRCIECGKKFKDKATLDNHEICHIQNNLPLFSTTKPIFTCSTCNANFAVQGDLFVHSSLHDDCNTLVCKTCNKKFSTFFKFKRHIPSHFQEKPFKCQVCEMRFVEIASLTRHYRVHTGVKPKSTHCCLDCKKTFSNRYTLQVHKRYHTGERPWKCDNCDKKFFDFRLLNSHKRIHDQTKPFECQQCKKSFRHRSSLVTHLRIHTNSNRPYRCEKCKKAFKQSWRLQLHKRQIHSTAYNRRFLCDQCSQIFTSYPSLEDHLQWHSKQVEIDNDDTPNKEAPPEFFQCNECSAQFSSRLDLITHQKLTHALRHECDTCFGKWKTLEELVRHKCNEALKASDEPSPDEMILLPNGQIQDCNTIVDNLLASVLQQPATTTVKEKETTKTT